MSYRRRRYVNQDPYPLKARFDSDCAGCGKRIRKGDSIYYWPNGRKAYCECGEKDYRAFLAAKQDEAWYQSQYSGR